MKLKEALELGRDCGLERVVEAIVNVEIHQTTIFGNNIAQEMSELYRQMEGYTGNELIADVLASEQ